MNAMTPGPLNHWIKWEGCEREYMTRADSIDIIRACASVDIRTVTTGNIIGDVSNLSDDVFFTNATNVIRIAGTIRPPHQPGELVDWTFHGRPDDAVLHSMWHWELESGEYFQAVKK